MTRINPSILIGILLLVGVPFAGFAYAIYNGMLLTSGGGRLIASLIGAVVILVGGEILIKMKGLTGTGEKATRVAFILGALIVATVGIYHVLPTGVPANNQSPNWLTNLTNRIGWFGALSAAVIGLTLAFGAWRYSKIPGNASAYLFMGVVAFFVIFGAIFIFGKMVAPYQTQVLLDAARVSIEQGAEGLTKPVSPYGHRAIDWEGIGSLNWGKFFGILFFGACVIGFIAFLIKGNKIATFLFVVTASLLVLPTAFYFSWTNVVPEPVQEYVTGAAKTVYEANPFLGKERSVNLRGAPGNRLTIADIGPYDTLKAQLPNGCSVDWKPTSQWLQQWSQEQWYDPSGYYLYNLTGSASWVRYYGFTETFKEGLKKAETELTLEIWAVCQ